MRKILALLFIFTSTVYSKSEMYNDVILNTKNRKNCTLNGVKVNVDLLINHNYACGSQCGSIAILQITDQSSNILYYLERSGSNYDRVTFEFKCIKNGVKISAEDFVISPVLTWNKKKQKIDFSTSTYKAIESVSKQALYDLKSWEKLKKMLDYLPNFEQNNLFEDQKIQLWLYYAEGALTHKKNEITERYLLFLENDPLDQSSKNKIHELREKLSKFDENPIQIQSFKRIGNLVHIFSQENLMPIPDGPYFWNKDQLCVRQDLSFEERQKGLTEKMRCYDSTKKKWGDLEEFISPYQQLNLDTRYNPGNKFCAYKETIMFMGFKNHSGFDCTGYKAKNFIAALPNMQMLLYNNGQFFLEDLNNKKPITTIVANQSLLNSFGSRIIGMGKYILTDGGSYSGFKVRALLDRDRSWELPLPNHFQSKNIYSWTKFLASPDQSKIAAILVESPEDTMAKKNFSLWVLTVRQ